MLVNQILDYLEEARHYNYPEFLVRYDLDKLVNEYTMDVVKGTEAEVRDEVRREIEEARDLLSDAYDYLDELDF